MNGAPSSLVSPGLWGFLAFFLLAVALYLLMRNMNARMRRMSYRAEELRRQAEDEDSGKGGPTRSEADGPVDRGGPGVADDGSDDGPDGGSGGAADGRREPG